MSKRAVHSAKLRSAEKEEIFQQTGQVEIGTTIEELYKHINIGGDVIKKATVTETPAQRAPAKKPKKGKTKDTTLSQSKGAEQKAATKKDALPNGIGLYIWHIQECEQGDPLRIAERAVSTGLSHVILQIADGTTSYVDDPLLQKTAAALKERRIAVWGWHYLKGEIPEVEADIAIKCYRALTLQGCIAHVEHEFKNPEAGGKIRTYLKTLRQEGIITGISSYHFPFYHSGMPWQDMMANADFSAPQIFWEHAHNPGAQLARSLLEYNRFPGGIPFFPVGSAYTAGDWQPTVNDLIEFIQVAYDLSVGENGVSLFHWDWLGKAGNEELWDVLKKMAWQKLSLSHQTIFLMDEVDIPASAKGEQEAAQASPVGKEAELQPPPEGEASSTPPPGEQVEPPAEALPFIQEPKFDRKYIPIVYNDEVAKAQDLLGFDRYAEALVNTVLDERATPPLTVGITAAWGSGKSFLLDRIQRKVEEKSQGVQAGQVHVVRFNAWDYNTTEAVWPGLVRRILDEMEARAGFARRIESRVTRNLRRQWNSTRDKFIPILGMLIAAVLVVGLTTAWDWGKLVAAISTLGLGGIVSNFLVIANKPMAQWLTNLFSEGRAYGNLADYNDEIRDDIQQLGRNMPEGFKIVVIVDDLDRCSAKKIVETLEAIKLLLSFDFFVIVLAIDSSVIARAIETQYKEVLPEVGRTGYFYLDKIIQIPFRIPQPTSMQVAEYLFGLLNAANARPKGRMKADKAAELAKGLITLVKAGISSEEKFSVLVPGGAGGSAGGFFPPGISAEKIKNFVSALPETSDAVHIIIGFGIGTLGRMEIEGERAASSSGSQSAWSDDLCWIAVIWGLLARWWPVSTFLMHKVMFSKPPADLNAPALPTLLAASEEMFASEYFTQQLRQQVDADLGMLTKAAEAAPIMTIGQLAKVLALWQLPYIIDPAFSEIEKSAFQRLADFIKKNPRHIKRLVNTYALIRMLALSSPEREKILDSPEAVIKWLLISSQWPLSAEVMLEEYNNEQQVIPAGAPLADNDNALDRLFHKARTRIEASEELKKERERLDGDPDILSDLIKGLTTITSSQINLLKTYTINFNPAEDIPSVKSIQAAITTVPAPQTASASSQP